MKCLVGLGNPGDAFSQTRHNVGYLFLDFFKEVLFPGCDPFIEDKHTNALCFKSSLGKQTIFLLKPQTFMNHSGDSVKRFLKHHNINIANDLVIIHDDLDILFGDFKIHSKGPKVHNGVNSVLKSIKSAIFLRVRIGIQGETYELIRKKGLSLAESYVLKPFSSVERQKLTGVFEQATQALTPYLDL